MKTPKNACKHCAKTLPAGKQRYCGADCRQAAYRRRDANELGPELAGQLRQVRRLVQNGTLPESYGDAVEQARDLVKRVADMPGLVVGLLDYIVGVALAHHDRDTKPVEYEAAGGDHKTALLVYLLKIGALAELSQVASEAKQAVELAAETLADGAVGEELESILYARQVNHHDQHGDDETRG